MSRTPGDPGPCDLAGMGFYCSWSGGKDSAVALHEAVRAGGHPGPLLTMMIDDGLRSRSHGLSRGLLERQAAAMGLPIRFAATSWADYEETFRAVVGAAVADGFRVGVYGDVDFAEHRVWVELTTNAAGATAVLPLWGCERRRIVWSLLDRGFVAMIVAVRDGILSPDLLGRIVDADVLDEFDRAGVDPAGEHGEYHTVVVDGPLFRHRLRVSPGETSLRDGVWFLDLG